MNTTPSADELLMRIAELERALLAQKVQAMFNDNVIESAKVLIIASDALGEIQIFNTYAQELTGYTLLDLQQKNWMEVLAPRDKYPCLWDNFFSADRHKHSTQLELPIVTKQGEELYISWSNNNIVFNDEIIGHISIGIDVTGQRKAERILKDQKHQISEQNKTLLQINEKLQEAKLRAEENERKYKEAKNEWQLIFEAVGHPTIILDKYNNILAANHAVSEATGLSQRELLGMSCFQLFHDTFCVCPPDGCPHAQMLKSSQFETTEMEIEALGGTFLVSCTPVFDDLGEIKYIIHVATDISARKKAELAQHESERKLEEAQLFSMMGYYTLDIPKGLWIISKPVELIFGIDENTERTVDKWLAIIHPDDRDMMISYFSDEVIAQGMPFDKEYRICLPTTGEVRWLHGLGQVTYSEEGTPLTMFGSIQDITWRKETELELKNSKQQLQSQNLLLTELNHKLIRAKEKAEESDRLKSAFLANMSHEIRTPMNGIIGFTALLNEPSVSEEKRKRFTSVIHDSCTQLLTIVNDILDISKIETGQIELNLGSCNLNDVIADLHSFFKPMTQKNNVELFVEQLLVDEDVIVIIDDSKLRQILNNLLSNACKFTQQGHIKFGYQKQDTRFLFFVEDTGIGIPECDHAIIFDRFKQARQDKNRLYGGTGLGLSIARAYVEKMGGTIWFSSEPQKGTTFFFTLPISPEL